jgi:hypothetical protein
MHLDFAGEVTVAKRSVAITMGRSVDGTDGTKCVCVDAALNADETLNFPSTIRWSNSINSHTNSDTFTAFVSGGGTCTSTQAYVCAMVSLITWSNPIRMEPH